MAGENSLKELKLNQGIVAEVAFCPRKFYLLTLVKEGGYDPESAGAYFYMRRKAVEALSKRGSWVAKGISFALEEMGVTGTLWIYKSGVRKAIVVFCKDELWWERGKIKAGFSALAAKKILGEIPKYVLFVSLKGASEGNIREKWVNFSEDFVDSARKALSKAVAILSSDKVPQGRWFSERCMNCSFLEQCRKELSKPSFEGKSILVSSPGLIVRKRGRRIEVVKKGEILRSYPFREIKEIFLVGSSLTTATSKFALRNRISVKFFSVWGSFLGELTPVGNSFSLSRFFQYEALKSPQVRTEIGRRLLLSKFRNEYRVLQKRFSSRDALLEIKRIIKGLQMVRTIKEARGIEGSVSKIFFEEIVSHVPKEFAYSGRRTRRPPLDPFNAALSFSFAMLLSVIKGVIEAQGLDPYVGVIHSMRHGRPSLALDLMEPYRPIFASMVLGMFNRGEFKDSDFVYRGEAVFLNGFGRAKLFKEFSRRLRALSGSYSYSSYSHKNKEEEIPGNFEEITDEEGSDNGKKKSLMGWIMEDAFKLRRFFNFLGSKRGKPEFPYFYMLP